jgi:putative ABC transport system ATP-binding protein
LIGVAFKLIPARHRLGVLTEAHIEKIIKSRAVFKEMLERNGDNNFVPFQRDVYIGAQSIGDNLIFGKVRLDRRDARSKIDRLIVDVVSEQNLRASISLAGLNYDVGVSGSRLSVGQRHKIAMVRALLKQPAILILDDIAVTGSDDDRIILEFLIQEFQNTTIVFGAPRLDLASKFEQIIYMKGGRMIVSGPYDKVAETSGID